MIKHYFQPDEIKELINDVSIDWIKSNKIDFLILDVDNTLVIKGDNHVDEATDKWLKECAQYCKTVLMCSNNMSHVAHDLSLKYNCFGINLALKPFKLRLSRFIRKNNIEYTNACVIGDQLFTDIWLAKRFKYKSILVQRLNRQDYGLTKLFRCIEKMLLEKKNEK